MSTGQKFERAVAIVARLRAPGGCPWDREQTFDSITKYTLEETYEVLDAIAARDWPELASELGDLLLQVLFYSEMAQEIKAFNIDQVLDALSDKLISRHPHVFGDVKANDSAQVLKNWEALKAEERRSKAETTPNQQHTPESILDSISRKTPALLEAHKISSKACHVGFDWPDIEGLFDKLEEEVHELKAHIRNLPSGALAPRNQSRIPETLRSHLEDEVGDLFFVLVNIARYLSVEPEMALRRTNLKFRRRFGWMESQLRDEGVTLEQASLDKMEELWQQAKTLERAPK